MFGWLQKYLETKDAQRQIERCKKMAEMEDLQRQWWNDHMREVVETPVFGSATEQFRQEEMSGAADNKWPYVKIYARTLVSQLESGGRENASTQER